MKKTTHAYVAIASICALLSGCASDKFQRAGVAVQSTTLAYGIVADIKSADTSENRNYCAKNNSGNIQTVCANLKGFDEARLVFLHSSRFLQRSFFVPVEWKVRDNSIVQVNPVGSYVATRIASAKPRKGCEWTGHSLSDLNGGTAMVKGFAMGLLIVPAVAVAADETIHQGGIECDGWSYTTLLQNS